LRYIASKARNDLYRPERRKSNQHRSDCRDYYSYYQPNINTHANNTAPLSIMGSITPVPNEDSLTISLLSSTNHYTESNPLSHASHTTTSRHLPGGNTRTVLHTPPFPLTFSTASSCTLTTVDGHTLTDFLNEYTAGIFGHSHPVIKSALESAIARGWNYGGHSGLEGLLAREICERWDGNGVEMVRFANSGTEANMLALAVAGAWSVVNGGQKQRRRVLVFNKGYHGSTISGRLDTRGAKGKVGLNLPWEFVVGGYNDVEGTRKLIAGLDGGEGKDLAAILVEPVLGSGGCFAATREFLAELRAIADETGALLVFDEVMTSRLTPAPSSATADGVVTSRWGVRPDLMTLGKWVGGGMSFGAFGGRREIMELFDPAKGRLEHPGTFNNNVFTMVAGVAGLGVVTQEVLQGLNAKGDELRARLDSVLSSKGLGSGNVVGRAPGEKGELQRPLTDDEQEDLAVYTQHPPLFVKGVGSMLALHFTGPRRAEWHQLLWLWMVEHGFWIAARGFMSLSIELKQQHYDGLVAVFEEFVEKYHRDLLEGHTS
jgi:glutamate-1-semialdehyde 2,1-aminomutase